jgi:flavin reductase (DIM6/NTAB) family NADH-FMN oxidoreductase RutF
MLFTKTDIASMHHHRRIQLVNSITGYKSANLIGTRSKSVPSRTNLAVFSSVTHFGSDPAVVGLVTRPLAVERHTYSLIKELGYYTINHIREDYVEKAHNTSAKYAADQSEFKECGFTEQTLGDFPAPFVKEAGIKFGLKWLEEYPIKCNATILIIGEIMLASVEDSYLDANGRVRHDLAGTMCINGLDTYCKVEEAITLPFL